MISNSTIRALTSILLLCGAAALPSAGSAVEAPYALADGSGYIEALNFADSTMVIGGLRYRVAVDVKVEIGGTFGAFTMLKAGMPVRFEYLKISPTERRVVLIQELPPGVEPLVT